jgi:hypothetical protein
MMRTLHVHGAAPSPLIPAKAGIQERLAGLNRVEASRRNGPPRPTWIPAFAGMSGVGFVENVR